MAASRRSHTSQPTRRRQRQQHAVLSTLVAVALAAGHAEGQITAAPASVSGSAGTLSPVLSPSFAGMGIEPINLFSFTGTTTANALTMNLLDNLASYTGVPPHLRIGGNSGDHILFRSDTQHAGYQVYTNPSPSGQGSPPTDNYFVGTGYFGAMDMLPKGTPVTFGLNMAYSGSDYLTQIVNQANAPLSLLKNVSVVGFEVGNEPDLFVQNGYRTSGWTVTDYGTEWANRVVSIYQNVLQPKGISSAFFEPAATATTATNNGKPYRISNLVNTGVATDNGIYVAGWNQHDYYYYTDVSTYTLTLPHLLDLSNTVSQFTEWAGQAQQAAVTGKPYYLREMGSVGPTGMQGITDVFANTLWTLNFFLYAATLQISSVQMHMTSNSYASPWVPAAFDDQTPHVRTTYYAWAAIDQIIGKSCTTRVASLTLNGIPSSYRNHVVGYTSYTGSSLRAVILINTQLATTGSTAGSVDVLLNMPDFRGQTVHISTLTASGADASSNTTWNGISYERSGNGQPTVIDSADHTLTVDGTGSVTVPVRDSQAVVVATKEKLGSETNVDTSACTDLTTNPEGGENVASETAASGATGTAPTFGGATTASGPQPTFKSTSGFAPNGAHPSFAMPETLVMLAAIILPGLILLMGA